MARNRTRPGWIWTVALLVLLAAAWFWQSGQDRDGVTQADGTARIAEAFTDTFAELHAVDYEAAGLGDLGRPQGYVQRQVEGWAKRYRRARTDDIPEIERMAAWLDENQPPESDAALIHNDYKYDNLVLDPDDWARVQLSLIHI